MYLSILLRELFMILAKGQLISKGLFGVFNSLKNGRKKIDQTMIPIHNTGIPRFTLLMWGHIKKKAESKTA